MKAPKKILILLMAAGLTNNALAQQYAGAQPSLLSFPDSVTVAVHASYNDVSSVHRKIFGKNFREDWAMPVKMPVIRISAVAGGLTPERQGGGFESKSLRLKDASGKEWVLRSVEKVPDKLLPPGLKGTFAVDWVGDEFSGQHPYSALVVPPLAAAANVPFSNPVIGQVADDAALGEYRKTFAGMICLLEEREPNGPSDNTIKMERELLKNYNNRFDKDEWLRARLLDLLLGDWDRHEDQWRWSYKLNGKEKVYTAVPRDRDQVFHVTEGLLPTLASQPWLDPLLENFEGEIPAVRYSLFKTKFLNAYPDAQFSLEEWQQVVKKFVAAENDQVLEAGLRRFPLEIYRLRHDALFAKLKARRDCIPAVMNEYYNFIYRIADIRLTDKDESVEISQGKNNGTRVIVYGGTNASNGHPIMDINYDPNVTREIRLYLSGGNDQVHAGGTSTRIKLRIIGSGGEKQYAADDAAHKITVYDRPDSVKFSGVKNKFTNHLSDDTLNTHFVPNYPYSVWMPLATGAINADDGFLLGVGFKFTHQNGFRKKPYADVQQLMLTHSFTTNAFRINYKGEWIGVLGKADFTMSAEINAPDNTSNYFGRGNETQLQKFVGYRTYYRTRFDTYQFDPALRWHLGKDNTITTGPSFQFYHMDINDNKGRFVQNPSAIGTYDSISLNKNRAHIGWKVGFTGDHRNNRILPSEGYYVNIALQTYTGLNSESRSFGQLTGDITYYQKLNSAGTIVLSDRIGGGASLGSPAFYQSLYLGGQGNLLGYLRNRFAGQDMLYNNLQMRIKLGDVASYILPGQLGITGFYDTGKVWVPGEHSNTIHQGTGGGLYFSPAGLTILQLLAGHSKEGWYPYISLNFRI